MPSMIANNYGRVVNVSTIIASLAKVGDFIAAGISAPSYSMSKVALNMFTVSLAHDVKKHNILVNAYHPGVVDSDMSKGIPPTVPRVTPDQGAVTALWLANLPAAKDSPNGAFFDDHGKPLPW